MSGIYQMRELLIEHDDPGQRCYNSAISALKNNPTVLHNFARNADDVHLLASFNLPRLRMLYEKIGKKQEPGHNVANACIDFFVQVLEQMGDRIDIEKAFRALLPLLCFGIKERSTHLRRLATVLLSTHRFLLDVVYENDDGQRLLRKWLLEPGIRPQDESLLYEWTVFVAEKAQNCPDQQHSSVVHIESWSELKRLSKKLQALARTTGNLHDHVDDSILDLSRKFTSLMELSSMRACEENLRLLKSTETWNILSSFIHVLPCTLCTQRDIKKKVTESPSDLWRPNTSIDILGRPVGFWKVIFSSLVKTRLDEITDEDQRQSIVQRIQDLTEGRSLYSPAKLAARKVKMIIPVKKTFCTPGLFLLWEIDVAYSRHQGAEEEQCVKIWDLVDAESISKSLRIIRSVQEVYTSTHIDRCRRTQKQPLTFNTIHQSSRIFGRIDDEQTLQYASAKFFLVSDQVLTAMRHRSLAFEFPLYLSREQVGMIESFDRSALIVGRSGTGKTTCLIYKMLASHFQSRVDGNVGKGLILLTASESLAGKLQVYVRDLIRTLEPQLENDGSNDHLEIDVQTGEDTLPVHALSLEEKHFPLVCTFGRFLQLIEKAAR